MLWLQGLAQAYFCQVFNADQVTVYTPHTAVLMLYAATGTSGKVPIVCQCE